MLGEKKGYCDVKDFFFFLEEIKRHIRYTVKIRFVLTREYFLILLLMLISIEINVKN